MSKILPIDHLYTVADLETLKVISDPLRMRIMYSVGLANQLGELRTVKQLAEEVDTPASKLYYHINMLEKHGLLQVADTQIVSGIIEKHYQITAHDITIDREIFSAGVGKDEKTAAIMALFDSILDSVRADMLRLAQGMMADETIEAKFSGRRGQITRENARLTPTQADAFNERLVALMDEFRNMTPTEGEESNIYSFTVVFNPILGDKLSQTNL